MGEEQKYKNLDGLRGLAALVVVVMHYVYAFMPFLVSLYVTQRHSAFDRLVSTTPLQLPLAGNFAVCIFFVLSGFVLSLSFLRSRDTSVLISSAVRRYFRLMFPALVSIILVFFVLKLGLIHGRQIASITESNTLATFWNLQANLWAAIYQGFYQVFFTSFTAYTVSYNPVLWTMHFELYGSFLVFLFLAFFGRLISRWIFYLVFSLVFIKTYYIAFILGVMIADMSVNYRHVVERVNTKIVWGILLAGLLLGSWTIEGLYRSLYSRIGIPFFSGLELQLFAHILGSAMVVYAVLRLEVISKLLRTRPLQYLGKISFSLYLTHFVIMGSLACYLFSFLFPHFGYKFSVLLTVIPSFGVSLAIATAYTKYVDVPSITFSKRIGKYLLQNDANPLPALRKIKLLGNILPRPKDVVVGSVTVEKA